MMLWVFLQDSVLNGFSIAIGDGLFFEAEQEHFFNSFGFLDLNDA